MRERGTNAEDGKQKAVEIEQKCKSEDDTDALAFVSVAGASQKVMPQTLVQAHEATPRQRDGEKRTEKASAERETIALDRRQSDPFFAFFSPRSPTYLRRQSPPACAARSLVARRTEAARLLKQQQKTRGLQKHRRRRESSALLLPPPLLLLHRLLQQQRAWERGGSRGAWLSSAWREIESLSARRARDRERRCTPGVSLSLKRERFFEESEDFASRRTSHNQERARRID